VYAVARGHRKIIRVPHKPGMITRWPFSVTPPRPRSSQAAALGGRGGRPVRIRPQRVLAWWRPVAMQGPDPVGAFGCGGAVGVQGQGPAAAVDDDEVMESAEQGEV